MSGKVIDYKLNAEQCVEIADVLNDTYGDLIESARILGIKLQRLKNYINCNHGLHLAWKQAQESIKNLTDSNVIQFLKHEDEKVRERMTRQMVNLLYSGQRRGGYSPKELGTMGNDDLISEELKEKAESKQIIVVFNGEQMPINDFQFVEGEVLGEENSPNEIDGDI